MPDPRPDTQTAGTPPAQVTVPPAQEPQASAPKTASETQAAAASDTSSDARADALATPNAEPVVAIFLVREEIKTLAELSNKIVAIDASQADEVTNIKIAISKAGAKDVRISEDRKFALGRVMDGEVPAGVISVVSPEEAAQWTGVPGHTVLRLPLARIKANPG